VPAMAAKLKDGLFLGDFETAQDMEFILANKVRRRSDSMPVSVVKLFFMAALHLPARLWLCLVASLPQITRIINCAGREVRGSGHGLGPGWGSRRMHWNAPPPSSSRPLPRCIDARAHVQ
jgi:hypothetical protein